MKDTKRNPFEGIGKPEPLKHALSGYWSRRITDEHRLIYKVPEDAVEIALCPLYPHLRQAQLFRTCKNFR
ncbi:MAG: Txe/YoeB family addiction module toxin [Desulfatiglandaceae bacterium]